MAAKKFLRLVAGICTEVLGIVTSAGAANDGDIPVLDATGRLDASLMPVGVAADTFTANTSEAVAAGAFVYITATGLIANASAASGGNQARGFVLAASASGAPATVYFEGRNTQLTGLTVGGRYYLSDSVAGGVTVTAVTGAGKKLQLLGYAVSTTSIDSEIDDYIALLA